MCLHSDVTSLQGLEWLHKRGRAICDLKPDNIRVQMGQQPGTFAHVTLIDLGGSVKYKGECEVQGSNAVQLPCLPGLLCSRQASDSHTTHFFFLFFCCVVSHSVSGL